MCEEASAFSSQMAATHLFGMKYVEVISKNKLSSKEIVLEAGLKESISVEVVKGCKLSELIRAKKFGLSFAGAEPIESPNLFSNIELNTIYSPYRNYITAIKSKPFLLLAGISGTGKSRIVRELARACWSVGTDEYKAHKPKNFEMVQVKPNWQTPAN